jgi:uncharacterized protein YggE
MDSSDDAIRRTVVVVGQGSASAVPDRCVVSVSLRVMCEAVADAIRDVAAVANDAMAALRAVGIDDADVRTRNLGVQDWFDQQQQRVSAHVATYLFSVGGIGLSQVPTVISALAEVAGDALHIDGITFSHSDPAPLYAIARRDAVVDARTRAEQLADAAGVRLGEILMISEGVDGGGGAASVGRMHTVAAAAMPITPGDQTVAVRIAVTFAIETAV